MILPGNVVIDRSLSPEEAEFKATGVAWHRFQMPAYHLVRTDGRGVSLINIGVGPANAKNITDHLAVLRPHCWLMVGHCAGLRQSQQIGDYVLAHAYLRRDNILDDAVPLMTPIPAIAEVQVAMQQAVANVTGEKGDQIKRRLRTGTVVTNDDRNWELRWSKERRLINVSRAIAVDMESATVATQGFRMRVPYGTLLCVSDKPLHGEIKLPGAANAFYERSIGEHLQIGLAAIGLLQSATRRCTRASSEASTSRRSADARTARWRLRDAQLYGVSGSRPWSSEGDIGSGETVFDRRRLKGLTRRRHSQPRFEPFQCLAAPIATRRNSQGGPLHRPRASRSVAFGDASRRTIPGPGESPSRRPLRRLLRTRGVLRRPPWELKSDIARVPKEPHDHQRI